MMTATASIGSLSSWKQNSDGDMYQVYKPRPSPKPRQISSSPRYVRTWSQEEESYLLEARRARVPYKDIAARLNKTDLACRLHYHQMVVARKNAAPGESAISSPSPEQRNAVLQYHDHQSESLPPITTSMSPQMLLPAPVICEPSRNASGAALLNPSHRRTFSQPQTPGRRHTTPSPPLAGITKPPVMPPASRSRRPSGSVDLGRIQELYRDLAPALWETIAVAYSQDKTISRDDIQSACFQGQFQGQGLGLPNSEPISPNSSNGISPVSSWLSTVSRASSSTSIMTTDDRGCPPQDHSTERSNTTRCSVNSLLNN